MALVGTLVAWVFTRHAGPLGVADATWLVNAAAHVFVVVVGLLHVSTARAGAAASALAAGAGAVGFGIAIATRQGSGGVAETVLATLVTVAILIGTFARRSAAGRQAATPVTDGGARGSTGGPSSTALALVCLATPSALPFAPAGSLSETGPVVAAGMALAAAVAAVRVMAPLRALDRVAAASEHALRREQVLRTAAALLVPGAEVQPVHETVVGGALAALEDEYAAVWFLWPGTAGGYVVAAGNVAPAAGTVVPSLGTLRAARADATVTALDVVVGDRPYGHLVVLTDDALPGGAESALEILVAQAGLALEARLLTEDLHRRRGDERLHRLVQDTSDIVALLDSAGAVRYVTPAVNRVLGRLPGEVVGRFWRDLVDAGDREVADSLLLAPGAHRRRPRQLRLTHADGGTRHVEAVVVPFEDGDDSGFVLTCHDVTDRQELEEQLRHQAFHDPLTGLANRALFRDRLEHALSRRSAGSAVAVLLCDLDDFKTINDSLGHAAGDALLLAVTERIRAGIRESDTAARLGGDEFAILLELVPDEEVATATADRLLASLREPIVVEDADLLVGLSVGIVTTTGGCVPEELMRDADLALYVAKSRGKNCAVHFEPEMHSAAVARLQLTGELRHAIERAEFVVHYQPIVDLHDGSLLAFEALVRWEHPVRGRVSPAEFIPLAEECGLIVPLGLHVLERALSAAVLWTSAHGRGIPVSVNLSGRQIAEATVVEDIAGILRVTGADPSLCLLEITESVLLDDVETTVERLEAVRRLGVQLLIDDFGTGYSSLSRLQQLPVDGLKAAREFVAPLPGSAGALGLARSIQSLAESVGLLTVAEGIERPEQATALRELGYRYGQGFLLAPPMSEADVGTYLLARVPGQRRLGPGEPAVGLRPGVGG